MQICINKIIQRKMLVRNIQRSLKQQGTNKSRNFPKFPNELSESKIKRITCINNFRNYKRGKEARRVQDEVEEGSEEDNNARKQIRLWRISKLRIIVSCSFGRGFLSDGSFCDICRKWNLKETHWTRLHNIRRISYYLVLSKNVLVTYLVQEQRHLSRKTLHIFRE